MRIRPTIFAAASLATASPAAAAVEVWPLAPGERVSRDATPRQAEAIWLGAGRGEDEGALVAIRSDRAASVAVAVSDLVGPGRIPAAAVERFVAEEVVVTEPSTSLPAGGQGRYPDPLRPLAGPLRLPAGATVQVLVQVRVPAGAAPGRYAGTLSVGQTETSIALDVVDVAVDRDRYPFVANFDLPAIERAHGGASAELRRGVEESLLPLLRRHGVSPARAPYAEPQPDAVTWAVTAPSPVATALSRWLDLGFPWLDVRFAPRVPPAIDDPGFADARRAVHAQTLGTLAAPAVGRAFSLPVDEPATGDYPAVRRAAAALAQARPRVPLALTEQPSPAALAALRDVVDIWVPPVWYGLLYRDRLAELRAEGRRTWWYGYANDIQYAAPGILLDEPLAEPRYLGWLAERDGIEAMFYWSLNAWRLDPNDLTSAYRDPWRDPFQVTGSSRRPECGDVGRRIGGNGEATLIYPTADRLRPAIGSLRLVAIRDGIEDVSLLAALRARDPAEHARLLGAVAPGAWGPVAEVGLCRAARPAYLPDLQTTPADVALARRLLVNRLADGPTGTLAGVVREGARPARGVTVRVGPFRTLTDVAGRWSIARLPPMRVTVRAGRDPDAGRGGVSAVAAVAAGATTGVELPALAPRRARPAVTRAELARARPRAAPAAVQPSGSDGIVVDLARTYTPDGRVDPSQVPVSPDVDIPLRRGVATLARRDWRGFAALEMTVQVLDAPPSHQPWRLVVTPGVFGNVRQILVARGLERVRVPLAGMASLRRVDRIRIGVESALGRPLRAGLATRVRLRVSDLRLVR